MRRYRGSNIKIDWKDDELIDLAQRKIDGVVDETADIVIGIARKNLIKNSTVDTGRLSSQISIYKNVFKNGAVAVVAQGPGDYGPKRFPKDNPYYASFVELGGHYATFGKYTVKKGTSKQGPLIEPKPFLRPAIKAARRRFRKLMVEAMAGGQNID